MVADSAGIDQQVDEDVAPDRRARCDVFQNYLEIATLQPKSHFVMKFFSSVNKKELPTKTSDFWPRWMNVSRQVIPKHQDMMVVVDLEELASQKIWQVYDIKYKPTDYSLLSFALPLNEMKRLIDLKKIGQLMLVAQPFNFFFLEIIFFSFDRKKNFHIRKKI